MGRPLRTNQIATTYHVFNRGAARQPIFFDARDRVEFERLFGIAHDRYGLVVHSYCLMTNHYHVLVEVPEGGLSDAMHDVGATFVRHLNDRQGRDGPLFRDRFSAKPVSDDAYFSWLVRYIHRNPLAFVSPEELGSYRWSSLRIFMGDRRLPQWMRTERVLRSVGGREGFLRLVFTDDDASTPLPVEAWFDLIDLLVEEQLLDDVPKQHVGRTVATLLLDRLRGDQRTQLAAVLAFPTPQAERSALSRARRRAEHHPQLARITDEIARRVT